MTEHSTSRPAGPTPASGTNRFGISEPTVEKLRLYKKKSLLVWHIFRGNWMGMIGLIILLFFVIMAVFAAQLM